MLDLRPHSRELLASSDDARAIILEIPAAESLQDHQVHERAWVVVVDGEVEIATGAGEMLEGGAGLLVSFAPGGRHAVQAPALGIDGESRAAAAKSTEGSVPLVYSSLSV